MIFCRLTKTDHLQIVYLNDTGLMGSQILQVKVESNELVHIQDCLDKGVKRIENYFDGKLQKEAYFEADIVGEGLYYVCLYHATQKALITIKGETMSLRFHVLLELKKELKKLSPSV